MTRLPASIMAVALAAAACLAVPAPASADVQLSMHDGRVTLKATNATVREILAEWAKVGQARIVNGERLTGTPLSIELTNVTEGQALDVLLRTVAGYVAAPRPTPVPNGSQFDRILILPTSTPPPRPSAAPPAPSFPQPPQFSPPPIPDDDDDDQPRGLPGPGQRGPVFNTFPQPVPPGQPVTPGQPMPAGAPPNFPFNAAPGRNSNPPAGTTTPGAQMPVGVSVPGMIVPQQQPQPVPIQPQ